MQQTAYTSYAYLIPSITAPRLTRYMREDLARCEYPVQCHIPVKVRKNLKGKKRAVSVEDDPPLQDAATTLNARPSHPTKRKHDEGDDPEEVEVINISSDVEDEGNELLEAGPLPQSRGGANSLNSRTREAETRPDVMRVGFDSDDEFCISSFGDEEDEAWTYSHRPHPRQRRRTKSPTTMADLSDF